MMVLTRCRVAAMMSVRRRSALSMRGHSARSCAGVAHRADRIADLVRDARGELPECGKLGLLDSLRP